MESESLGPNKAEYVPVTWRLLFVSSWALKAVEDGLELKKGASSQSLGDALDPAVLEEAR